MRSTCFSSCFSHRGTEDSQSSLDLIEVTNIPKKDPLTHQIIGAAIGVHRELGPQLLESIYEEALCIELGLHQLNFERQKKIELRYKGHEIGTFFIDLVVDDSVIVELKSVAKLAPVHDAQLINYLKLTGLRRGLLINFHGATLKEGVKRIVV